MSTMSINDVAGNCDIHAATHHRLFELLGAWALDDLDPVRQRWYATAAHRHAWHAELWSGRRPTIPAPPTTAHLSMLEPPADVGGRVAWYREALAGLIADTQTLADEFDPVLDPGSLRVTRLVIADLTELVVSAPG